MNTFMAASSLARGYWTDISINCVGKWILGKGFDGVPWVHVVQVAGFCEYDSECLGLIMGRKCPRFCRTHVTFSSKTLHYRVN
jgi:hypothetical protein